MSKQITIEVEADNPVAKAVHESGLDAVTLIVDGERYKVIKENPVKWDPDAAREHFRKHAGFISEAEADEMVEELYRAREEGSQHNFPR